MRRTASAAIHRTNAVRSSSPRIAPGREAGAAGAASNRISVGASLSIYNHLVQSERTRTVDQWNPLKIVFDRPHEADLKAAIMKLPLADRGYMVKRCWPTSGSSADTAG
jgi:hypothetical protein